ncbi:conjugal transfer protein TraF [Helicobacter typhlonius]|uniref:conjugal transfer protein TraF n=1 Tax=Helicobacter typhlonius TaxID=76936 RepID=UPI002FDF8803
MLKHFTLPLGYVVLFVSYSFSLEFGSMGQVSAGMGGAGVALKDSAWGLYYNPALLGADRRTKAGYSFGLQFKEQNLLQMAAIDVDNLNDLPNTLNNQLLSGTGKSVTIGNTTIDGALGGALNALIPNPQTPGTITSTDLSNLLQELDPTTTACNSFTTCAQTISGNLSLANKLKDRLTDATNKGGSPLIGDIISGIDASNLGDVLNGLDQAGSTADIADKILENAGSLTIKKGADSVIDKLLNDFGVIDRAMKSNDVVLNTQNGFVFQFAGDKKQRRIESDIVGSIDIQEVDTGRGAVGIGLFASAFSNASVALDPNNNQLIFNLGGKYYTASANGDSVSLTHDPNKNDLQGSVMYDQAQHTLYANALALIEIPVGYGHTLFTPLGDVNVGVAVKFMQTIGYGQNLKFSVGSFPDVSFNKDDTDMAQTFAFDLGFLYTPRMMKNFNVGLVVKNLNAPVIKRTNNLADITLNRQVRAGISYNMMDFLTFAFDADLAPNDTLSLSSPKSQYIGGGIMANFKTIDFRLGAMRDLRSNSGEGTILTGGVNLLGFLDIALQYGLGQNINLYGVNVSNYMSARVGGQFSF